MLAQLFSNALVCLGQMRLLCDQTKKSTCTKQEQAAALAMTPWQTRDRHFRGLLCLFLVLFYTLERGKKDKSLSTVCFVSLSPCTLLGYAACCVHQTPRDRRLLFFLKNRKKRSHGARFFLLCRSTCGPLFLGGGWSTQMGRANVVVPFFLPKRATETRAQGMAPQKKRKNIGITKRKKARTADRDW